MKSSTKNKNLLFISLSNYNTLNNSIHKDILDLFKNKLNKIYVFCWGEKFYIKKDNIYYFSGNLITWFWYLKRIKKINYTYINDFFIGGLFGTFVKKTRKTLLFLRCGSPWKYNLNSPLPVLKTFLVNLTKPIVISLCDKVVYNSKAIIQRKYKHDYQIIYNGVDTELFKPIKTKRISEKLNLISIGNINREKGLEYLFQAIKQLQKEVLLTIVGDGPLLNKYKKEYPFVSFIGRIPHHKLPKIINQHDVFIHPSYVESFPSVVLEAMACGKPVIATKVYGIPEMITNKINGILVPPKNHKSIKKAIYALINNSSLIEKMGKSSRTVVKKKFEKDMQKKYALLFN
jgi:glycosyltransferase involved in cell wall biosynthesis